uniref:Uncharacterized protein n=1 Tax=Anguilla anguilla TaxID=7936 RepID=A0A0E9SHY7_ANGAN
MLTEFFPILFSASATLISVFLKRFVPSSTNALVWLFSNSSDVASASFSVTAGISSLPVTGSAILTKMFSLD